jgi:predicted transposase YbfD/YdcC
LQSTQGPHGDHGRIEVRRHIVSQQVDWLADGRFNGIKTIAMVERTVQSNGKTSCERHYYICSAALLATVLAHALRCHWHIENRLHWVLDVIFREDLSRLRSGYGPQNMAVVRHMAMNLLRAPTNKKASKPAANSPDGTQTISKLSCGNPLDPFKRFPCSRHALQENDARCIATRVGWRPRNSLL